MSCGGTERERDRWLVSLLSLYRRVNRKAVHRRGTAIVQALRVLFAMSDAPAMPSGCPVAHGDKHAAAPPPAGCPVAHNGGAGKGANATTAAAPDNCGSARSGASSGSAGSGAGMPSGCPVAHEQRVNPANNEMPANQRPAPGQRGSLPTERVTSTIPTGDAKGDPLWVYPSQQMFFNAMRRKGHTPHEEEMDAVVIHNAVNERAWGEVVAWEATLHPECTAGLKLLRFQGKPDEPTSRRARTRSSGTARRLTGTTAALAGAARRSPTCSTLQWPRDAGQARRDAHRRAPRRQRRTGHVGSRAHAVCTDVDGGDRALMRAFVVEGRLR